MNLLDSRDLFQMTGYGTAFVTCCQRQDWSGALIAGSCLLAVACEWLNRHRKA